MPSLKSVRSLQFSVLLSIIALTFPSTLAQIPQVTSDVMPPVPGAGYDYIHSLVETVEPQLGMLAVRINVPTPAGRDASLPFTFAYNSNLALHHLMVVSGNNISAGSFWTDDAGYLSRSGWRYVIPSLGVFSSTYPSNTPPVQCHYLANYIFNDDQGTPHAMGTMQQSDQQVACQPAPFITFLSGADGTYSASTVQMGFNTGIPPAVTVVNNEGTIFDFPNTAIHNYPGDNPNNVNSSSFSTLTLSSLPDFIETRNGNLIGIADNGHGAFTVTDQLARTVLQSSGFGGSNGTMSDTIQVSGLGSYTATWGPSQSYKWTYNSTVTAVPGENCFPDGSNASGSQPNITSIALPNGKSFQFKYDPVTGLLNEITYPTGAVVDYTWTANPLSTSESWTTTPTGQINRCNEVHDTPAVLSRIVKVDGVNAVLEQDFTYATTWGPFNGGPPPSRKWTSKQTTVVTKDLVRNTSFKTVYTYSSPLGPIANFAQTAGTAVYDTGGKLLRTSTKTWNAINDPPTIETMALDNGQVSQIINCYTVPVTQSPCASSNSATALLTDQFEYDYGSGSPGALLRHTHVDYQSFPANPLGVTPADRPSDVIVYDGNNNKMSETDYKYDETSVATVSATHHDGNFGTGFVSGRGNITTKTVKCFVGAGQSAIACPQGDSKITYAYDETGQQVSKVDANGNPATQYSYTDNFDSGPSSNTNAYLTKITRPKTNGVSHIESFKYAYSDGQLITQTDENNQQTSYVYNDPMRRLTEVDYADTGKVTYNYHSDSLPLTVTKTVVATPDPSIVSTTVYDGLGRLHKTSLDSDNTGPIYARTDYDGLGSAFKVWNPTRCDPDTSSSCPSENTFGITQSSYDSLGRILSVIHQDGTTLSTTYTGRATEVTEEGNGSYQVQRISQANGLGNVLSVCEVSGTTQSGSNNKPGDCKLDVAGSGFLTTYQYDTLGNLTRVSQTGMTDRTFTYDSLSRLVCASNPEISNTTTCPTPDSGSYTAGTVRYGYDANGNLISKTSPKPNQTDPAVTVTATYSPDALDRTYQKSYSDLTTTSGTPTAHIDFDGTSELGVSNLANTVGRISGEYVTDGNGKKLAGSIVSYDKVGRPILNSQCTPQNCPGGSVFNVAYSYDLAGAMASASNGEGVTLSYSYDGGGRLSSVTSSLSDANHPGTLVSNTAYGPMGLTQESLGNGLQENRSYHQRGWPQSKQIVNPNGLPGQGSVTINGSLQSTFQSASPGHGDVSIGGPGWQVTPDGQMDIGTIWITINGNDQELFSYGQQGPYFGCPASYNTTALYQGIWLVASLMANCVTAQSPYVTASVDPPYGTTIHLRARSSGSSTNYALDAGQTYDTVDFSQPSFTATPSGASLTGGSDSYTTYDSGTTTITVNGKAYAQSWQGSSTTAASVGSALCSAMNGDTNGLVWASTNGTSKQCPIASNTITMAARNPGQATNYTLRASSSSSYNSFSVTCPGFSSCDIASLTGGVNLATLYSFNINTFAPDGNITSANDSMNGNWSYSYDDLNRLSTAVSHNGQGCSESYDRYGNRWSQQPYGTGNRCGGSTLSFTGNQTNNNNRMDGYSYDAAGNLLNDGCHAYAYDAENRIVSATPVGSCGGTGTYTYDSEGKRIRQISSSGTMDYLYDLKGHAMTAVTGAGSWNRGEIYVGASHLATYANGTTYFTHSDWIGTERIRTQMDETTYSTWSSLPFGEATSTADPSPLHFTGKERDETGIDYFGARYYSSNLGRWAMPDSVNVTDERLVNPASTLNKYVYGANNPLKYLDPDGRDIVIFYESGLPTGHVMLAAYNQATGDFAMMSVGPQTRHDPSIQLHPFSGVPGTSEFNLPTNVDELRKNFTAVTIQTNPEVAQHAIDLIRSGAGTGNWALFGNNCTTACVRLLKDIGLSPGSNMGIPWTPERFWENINAKYGNSSNAFSRFVANIFGAGSFSTPRNGYDTGRPRYGMNTFDWLMLMMKSTSNATVTTSQEYWIDCTTNPQVCTNY